MKITVLYVGSSLLAPLRNAERAINREHQLDLQLAAHNFGASFTESEWSAIAEDLSGSNVVFVIHVMDGENAARLVPLLDLFRKSNRALIVINCMPELMKRTRLGRLDLARFAKKNSRKRAAARTENEESDARSLLASVGSWIGKQAGAGKKGANGHGRAEYLKFADRLPALLRYVPSAGALRDVKNYLMLFCYFLQPSPANISAMLLHALREYVDDDRLKKIEIPSPETHPAVAIYHPDAPNLFESFAAYEEWYRTHGLDSKLDPQSTIGLLLMRPQIVSNARSHYNGLIRAIEAEGLSVVPAISTLMDNRQACEEFFVERKSETRKRARRVSQIVSLTGFSFVGGPAMNDSESAVSYLNELGIPYRSMISLDVQTIESWRDSFTGLNPVQTGMQVAIPEIDGGTEPFVFGGIPARGVEPAPLEHRCKRIARRLKRWHRLQTAPRSELKIALALYCFPPNKGNLGTAADLDVFASLLAILRQLKADGYGVEVPENVDALREMLFVGNSEGFGANANVACQLDVEEYRKLCPFVDEIEADWGAAPGSINAHDRKLLIQGINLGNVFIGVQPTFGYEDDPMRMLMARGGSPHHGFAAFYSYLEKVFKADAVIHVGTHGAMEFMPGKQVGMSETCWPDRLIGELPNIYIYSVNNPSEGTIAKRRSYAELISYLTPPIENAGLYKGLATLKDQIMSYRQSGDEADRARLYQSIKSAQSVLNIDLD